MERIEARDFLFKLFGIVDNAQDEGLGEGKVKSDSLRLLRQYREQDNYDFLRQTTANWLAIREIRLTEAEKIEMHKDNPKYWL